MKPSAILVSLALALTSPVGWADYPHSARDLAATCAGCHGTQGVSEPGMVRLAGMPAENMMQQLMDFRDGEREATIMHQITKGYTEEQLQQIADYFAAQE